MNDSEPILQNIRVVITRAADQSQDLRELLETSGAEVLELPLIQTFPTPIDERTQEVFSEMGTYEWIVFTSSNGVRYFFEKFFQVYKDIRSLGGMRIACIGKKTAEAVEAFHLQVDVIPEVAVADSLAEALAEFETLDNLKMLVVTGNQNREVLVEKLESNQAIVDTLKTYETEPVDVTTLASLNEFCEKGAHFVTFTSASTVKAFASQAKHLQLGPQAISPKTISIGPITSQTLQTLGIPLASEATEASNEGLIEAIKASMDKS